jgi:hypothetical protein
LERVGFYPAAQAAGTWRARSIAATAAGTGVIMMIAMVVGVIMLCVSIRRARSLVGERQQ